MLTFDIREKYRPDIDGLRAIAISAVIGFHTFPTFFRGGMPVGVKVPEKVALLPALSIMVAQLGLTETSSGPGCRGHCVAEAQRRGAAGATGIGRRAAIAERRCSCRNRHGFAHVERWRDHATDRRIATAVSDPRGGKSKPAPPR